MRNTDRRLRLQLLTTLVLGMIAHAAFGQVFVEPAKQISSLPFTISKPGTYYVQANLTGKSGQDGITINASQVTVDLQRYVLRGVPGSGVGIRVGDNLGFVTIEGGVVANWGSQGIYSPNSKPVINGTSADDNGTGGIVVEGGSVVENLSADSNTGDGIDPGDGSIVRGCYAHTNTGTGINAGLNCDISSCIVTANTGGGIIVSDNSQVSGCTVSANGNTGIQGGAYCLVSGCMVVSNAGDGIAITDNGNVGNCLSFQNAGNGITTGNFSPVANCTARNNQANGISVGGSCVVDGSICLSNGMASAAGILATGNGCSVHNNGLIGNGVGVKVTGTACTIFQNHAHANTLGNYIIAGGNDFGPTGTVATSTSPWANISY